MKNQSKNNSVETDEDVTETPVNNDVNNTSIDDEDETSDAMLKQVYASEKEVLIANLTKMGIPFKASYGLKTLRDLYNSNLNSDEDDVKENLIDENKLTRKEYIKRIRNKAFALVRVRVNCLNPQKQHMTGDIFSVSNSLIGTKTRAVPFGDYCENGYHMETFMYEFIKSKKMQVIRTKRVNGHDLIDPESLKLVPEYSIEVLPPLTKEEIEAIKQRQLAMNSLDS